MNGSLGIVKKKIKKLLGVMYSAMKTIPLEENSHKKNA
jgi:hypothetical protein